MSVPPGCEHREVPWKEGGERVPTRCVVGEKGKGVRRTDYFTGMKPRKHSICTRGRWYFHRTPKKLWLVLERLRRGVKLEYMDGSRTKSTRLWRLGDRFKDR